MGDLLQFRRVHDCASAGYKSGRRACRGTPEIRSTSKTRKGGTSSHCETACGVMPRGPASPASPPAASIARSSALLRSAMVSDSSIALLSSQALLHCATKAALYDPGMNLGNRLKLARERLTPKPTQGEIGDLFGISDKAVSAWERGETIPDHDKIPHLRRKLRLTYAWLIEGGGPPPSPNDPLVLLEDELSAKFRAMGERNATPGPQLTARHKGPPARPLRARRGR